MRKSSDGPIICFGQQPCGFFPKRFLTAKIDTARELQKKIGGKVVFFYHDSDADFRETITIMKDKQTGAEARLNFTQENKLQKKHSPLYAKRIPSGWKQEIQKQLPRFINQNLIEFFSSIKEKNAADFCLKMYSKLGILENIEIARSSNTSFRKKAMDLTSNYFADVKYQGEIVRAKISKDGKTASLHEGGEKYTIFPVKDKIQKEQITPKADQRLDWMQSVVRCTHYVFGEGEAKYLKFKDFPDIKFIPREKVNQPQYAWLPLPNTNLF
jgi:hypothetical protein